MWKMSLHSLSFAVALIDISVFHIYLVDKIQKRMMDEFRSNNIRASSMVKLSSNHNFKL